MNKVKKTICLWGPVFLWCGFIFYLSSVPNLRVSQDRSLDEVLRSGAHFIFYAILYLLVFRAKNFAQKKKDFLTPLAFALLYGISDEIHQLFVATRSFQLRDLGLDTLGGFLGCLVLRIRKLLSSP